MSAGWVSKPAALLQVLECTGRLHLTEAPGQRYVQGEGRFEMSRDTVTVSAAESGWGVVGEVCV